MNKVHTNQDYMRVVLLSECNMILGNHVSYSLEDVQEKFLDQFFLDRLFKLFDFCNTGEILHGRFIDQIKHSFSSEEEIDFAEQMESVAYVLCGEQNINKRKFMEMWCEKDVVRSFFKMLDLAETNNITASQIIDFVFKVTELSTSRLFDKTSIQRLEALFRSTVGNEQEIRLEDFKKIAISKNPFFTDRMFQIFDKDNSGSISLQEFIDAIKQFSGQSPDDKIKFLFKVYDIDGDGLIQQKELQHVMRACMEENGMQFSEDQIDDLTMALFEDADKYNIGAITYDALKNQLEQHAGLLENLSISIERWLVPLPKLHIDEQQSHCCHLPHQLTPSYIKNNSVYLVFLMSYVALNVVLFVSRAIHFRNHNIFVIIARACGQCLNFNCSFILVLMLRKCITFLRSRGFGGFLPLDNHIYLHKMTGCIIAILSVIHSIMHILNLYMVVVNSNANSNKYSIIEWIFTTRPAMFGLINGWANPTGVCLLVILTVIIMCSLPFVRRGGSFEIFYWSHLLYLPFWILTTIHSPNHWRWMIIPCTVYMIERSLNLAWVRSGGGKTFISSGLLLPSKVTHLVIKRPIHFYFHPGDYIFVKIPSIAKYEWHPFTISSAPEQEDYIWLHIRGVGEWTNRLYGYFEQEHMNISNGRSVSGSLLKTRQKISRELGILSDSSSPNLQSTKAVNTISMSNLKNGFSIFKSSIISSEAYPYFKTPAMLENNKEHGLTNIAYNDDSVFEKYESSVRTSKQGMNMAPLVKSFSMPNFSYKKYSPGPNVRIQKYIRSYSGRAVKDVKTKNTPLHSIGLPYKDLQNKSLERSFRYMRHKPTIIAFKTPLIDINEDHSLKALDTKENDYITRENYHVGKPLELYIDGPYGAPSSHIFRAQHAVLIATGIGVTPFASILQSIMHRYWKGRHSCPRCEYEWSSEIPQSIMNLRKVDFFWINRNQRSFEWFVNLLSQLEIEQAELGGAMERFLDMHMYITSALQKTDMKAVGLQLALDLLHKKEKRDLITGLKTRTNAGRPNWNKVFKQIQAQRKGKVTVFYCGPAELAKLLRYKCDQYGFTFRKEIF